MSLNHINSKKSLNSNGPNKPTVNSSVKSKTYKKQSPHPLNESLTVFGGETILEPGMSLEDYYTLRETWYDKIQKQGHIELERYNEYNQGLVSSYMAHNTKESAFNPNNYTAAEYYDYLSTFEHHLDYLFNQPAKRKAYKINRFFIPEAYKRSNQVILKRANHYDLNRFILKSITAGVNLEAISRYLGQVEPVKHESDRAKLASVYIKPSTFRAVQGTNKNKLWQRIRLIHECAWQYLILEGLVDAQTLYSMDLLGLDNRVVNKFISDELGVAVIAQSIAPRHALTIY